MLAVHHPDIAPSNRFDRDSFMERPVPYATSTPFYC